MRRPFVAVTLAVLILAATVAGGFVIAACGSSDTTTDESASAAPGGGQMPDMSSMFTEALDPLVEAGTITSDEEDAVVEALTASMPSGNQGGEAPQGGDQPSPNATPTGTPPSAGASSDRGDMFSSALDELVDAGTITADQETAISEALSSAMQQGGPQQDQSQTESSSSSQSL